MGFTRSCEMAMVEDSVSSSMLISSLESSISISESSVSARRSPATRRPSTVASCVSSSLRISTAGSAKMESSDHVHSPTTDLCSG